MVGVGGRDDGDDDVTKNTYENIDDAMSIGAKEKNAFAVEATATPSAEESFREEEQEEEEEKTEDSKRGATRTEDEEENDEDERSSPPVITTKIRTKTTPKGNSVGLPHNSELMKLAIRPNIRPGGAESAIRSAPDSKGIPLNLQ